jgi:hypothetical protein
LGVTVGGGAVQIVDLATLTGAIMVALGPAVAGLFSNSDTLAEQLATAAKAAGEKLWRLPLEEECVRLSLHFYRQSDVVEADKFDGAAEHVTGLPSRALRTPGAEHLEISVLRPRVQDWGWGSGWPPPIATESACGQSKSCSKLGLSLLMSAGTVEDLGIHMVNMRVSERSGNSLKPEKRLSI